MRITLVLALAILASGHAAAEDTSKDDDIRRFFAITNVAELAMVDIRQNIELQKRANPKVPARFWTELLEEIKPSEFTERMVPIYDRKFTHEQIKAWLEFFESDAGQAFLNNQRAVLEESAAVGQAYVQEVSGSVARRLKLE